MKNKIRIIYQGRSWQVWHSTRGFLCAFDTKKEAEQWINRKDL
jgi:hypothetical protein